MTQEYVHSGEKGSFKVQQRVKKGEGGRKLLNFDCAYFLNRLVCKHTQERKLCSRMLLGIAAISCCVILYICCLFSFELQDDSLRLCLFDSKEASLGGVKMPRANLEGASLVKCNFEDPTCHKANLEG